MSKPGAKVMVPPITQLFRFLQNQVRVQIWLYANSDTRLEGVIMGFDEYLNVVLGDAAELDMKTGKSEPIGRIMLKGDNIALVRQVSAATE